VGGSIYLTAGATGTAAPTNGGAVSLGSVLTLLGGAGGLGGRQLELNNGTYNFQINAQLSVMAGAQALMAPAPKPSGSSIEIVAGTGTVEKAFVKVDPDATCIVTTKNRPQNNFDPVTITLTGDGTLYDNQGWTFIDNFTRLEIDGGESGADYKQSPELAKLDKAITRLAGGSEIASVGRGKPNFGHVNIIGDQLVFTYASGSQGVPLQHQDPAKISAPDNSPEPALYVARYGWVTSGYYPIFCTLEIDGKVTCKGEVVLRMDRTGTYNDLFKATEAITFGPKDQNYCQVRLSWDDPNAGPPVAVDLPYTLMQSDGLLTIPNVNLQVILPYDDIISTTALIDANKKLIVRRT
jgi:hypothetical protein